VAVHKQTIEVYEREAGGYASRRGVQGEERVEAFATAVGDGLRLDLGCGPGHYLPLLGRPAVASDAADAMCRAAAQVDPSAPVVRADLSHLPFARHAFAGIWASKAHQHLPATDLPMALAEVHRILEVGGRFDLTVFTPPGGGPTREEVTDLGSNDDLPGRLFTWWDPDHVRAVVEAAGFSIADLHVAEPWKEGDAARIEISAVAERRLPDYVAGGMRLLCCGLNPSLHAADAGVGYVTGNNRFWPAMVMAGLTDRLRDNRHMLAEHHIGMTDLVKRATPRASELTTAEFREGVERLGRLCDWLRPGAVAVNGLVGWRAAVDRKAQIGWQPEGLGESNTPIYVLPSTSGLNARVPLQELADHLRAAASRPAGR
jgi:TDG/mug DNA glycosylase family protein